METLTHCISSLSFLLVFNCNVFNVATWIKTFFDSCVWFQVLPPELKNHIKYCWLMEYKNHQLSSHLDINRVGSFDKAETRDIKTFCLFIQENFKTFRKFRLNFQLILIQSFIFYYYRIKSNNKTDLKTKNELAGRSRSGDEKHSDEKLWSDSSDWNFSLLLLYN